MTLAETMKHQHGSCVLGRSGASVVTACVALASAALGVAPASDPPTLYEQAMLEAHDNYMYDEFGYSAAIWSDTGVVGAPSHTIDGSIHGIDGAAYVFTRSNGIWTQQAELLPDYDSVWGMHFGESVAIWGNSIVVGAPGRGTVYVFVRNGGSWVQQARIRRGGGRWFGGAVAIRGDELVVGALGDDGACGGGTQCNSGAAYVFVRSGSTWTEVAKLTASDSAAGAIFGTSVSFDGDSIAIGAPYHNGNSGAAYVFVRNGASWVEQARFSVLQAALLGGSVAVHGDTLFVSSIGKAYVHRRSGTSWTLEAELAPVPSFGGPVAWDGEVGLVGASSGVLAFRRSGTAWTHEATLEPSGYIDFFGYSCALHEGRAFIGDFGRDDNCPSNTQCNSGVAYAYDLRTPGVRYCAPAASNSTGMPGRMTVFGSEIVDEDSLTLAASDLPPQPNTGYFLMGTGSNAVVPPGSAGPICVAPGIRRYFPPASTSEQSGGFTRSVGTRGPVSGAIAPGSTWNFQAWYRDTAAGTSNLTDAVSVSFL